MVSNPLFLNQCFDKNRLKNLITWSLLTVGERKTIETVEQLKTLGFQFATQAGVSLSVDDLKIPPEKLSLVSQARQQVEATQQAYQRGNLTAIEKLQQLVDTWHRTSETLKQTVVNYFQSTDKLSPVYMMAFSGARGNISQVRQLAGMRGLMADPQGQIIGFPIRSNFREGLTLTEYMISCYGARKGLVDTALRTADAGYLTRRLVDVSQHMIVKAATCATPRGIVLKDLHVSNKVLLPLRERLIGRVLAEDIVISNDAVWGHVPPNPTSRTSGKSLLSTNQQALNGSPRLNQITSPQLKEPHLVAYRNQEISGKLAFDIASCRDSVLVRSPLTCSIRHGVCQLCYGWSLSEGRLVTLGEAVGIIAAQSIGEPGTQLTMRTFHTGGVFSGDVMAEIRAPHDGVVYFPKPLQGLLIRTSHGRIAFLTKSPGALVLKTARGAATNNQKPLSDQGPEETLFSLESLAVLFVRQYEKVARTQLIAEFSSMGTDLNETIEAKRILFSEMVGQVSFANVSLGTRFRESGDIVQVSRGLGFVWILSGRRSRITPLLGLYSNGSHLVNQESLVARVANNLTLQESTVIKHTKLSPCSGRHNLPLVLTPNCVGNRENRTWGFNGLGGKPPKRSDARPDIALRCKKWALLPTPTVLRFVSNLGYSVVFPSLPSRSDSRAASRQWTDNSLDLSPLVKDLKGQRSRTVSSLSLLHPTSIPDRLLVDVALLENVLQTGTGSSAPAYAAIDSAEEPGQQGHLQKKPYLYWFPGEYQSGKSGLAWVDSRYIAKRFRHGDIIWIEEQKTGYHSAHVPSWAGLLCEAMQRCEGVRWSWGHAYGSYQRLRGLRPLKPPTIEGEADRLFGAVPSFYPFDRFASLAMHEGFDGWGARWCEGAKPPQPSNSWSSRLTWSNVVTSQRSTEVKRVLNPVAAPLPNWFNLSRNEFSRGELIRLQVRNFAVIDRLKGSGLTKSNPVGTELGKRIAKLVQQPITKLRLFFRTGPTNPLADTCAERGLQPASYNRKSKLGGSHLFDTREENPARLTNQCKGLTATNQPADRQLQLNNSLTKTPNSNDTYGSSKSLGDSERFDDWRGLSGQSVSSNVSSNRLRFVLAVLAKGQNPLEEQMSEALTTLLPGLVGLKGAQRFDKLDNLQIKQGWVYCPHEQVNVAMSHESIQFCGEDGVDNLFFEPTLVCFEAFRDRGFFYSTTDNLLRVTLEIKLLELDKVKRSQSGQLNQKYLNFPPITPSSLLQQFTIAATDNRRDSEREKPSINMRRSHATIFTLNSGSDINEPSVTYASSVMHDTTTRRGGQEILLLLRKMLWLSQNCTPVFAEVEPFLQAPQASPALHEFGALSSDGLEFSMDRVGVSLIGWSFLQTLLHKGKYPNRLNPGPQFSVRAAHYQSLSFKNLLNREPFLWLRAIPIQVQVVTNPKCRHFGVVSSPRKSIIGLAGVRGLRPPTPAGSLSLRSDVTTGAGVLTQGRGVERVHRNAERVRSIVGQLDRPPKVLGSQSVKQHVFQLTEKWFFGPILTKPSLLVLIRKGHPYPLSILERGKSIFLRRQMGVKIAVNTRVDGPSTSLRLGFDSAGATLKSRVLNRFLSQSSVVSNAVGFFTKQSLTRLVAESPDIRWNVLPLVPFDDFQTVYLTHSLCWVRFAGYLSPASPSATEPLCIATRCKTTPLSHRTPSHPRIASNARPMRQWDEPAANGIWPWSSVTDNAACWSSVADERIYMRSPLIGEIMSEQISHPGMKDGGNFAHEDLEQRTKLHHAITKSGGNVFFTEADYVSFVSQGKQSKGCMGDFMSIGEELISGYATPTSGQIIAIEREKITLRRTQPLLFYAQGVMHVNHGEWVEKNAPILTLTYRKLVTGDIVQGIPKIEQFFEAPITKEGEPISNSLQARLRRSFQRLKQVYPVPEAVKRSLEEIQQILVEGILKVYLSQGVRIADKHLEIVIRQMTSKGQVLDVGKTGLFQGEDVNLDRIERINLATYGQKADYEPAVLGITQASLDSESFISAASFQETTRVLSRDTIIGKTDFLRGLKERVVLGDLIQAGTGVDDNINYGLLFGIAAANDLEAGIVSGSM